MRRDRAAKGSRESLDARRPERRLQACLLLWLLAAFSGVAAALQSPASDALSKDRLRMEEFQKETWQVEQGLPDNNVRMLVQQPDGMLLLATGAGLASFDGLRFAPFGGAAAAQMRNEAVNALVYGGSGDLWIGTDGRGVLHQVADRLEPVPHDAAHANERVRMLHLQRGPDGRTVLWIASQYGVERFDGQRTEPIEDGGMIAGDLTSPFAEDGGGGMFYVTSSGLYHWTGGTRAKLVPLPQALGRVTAAYRDPAGQIWLGSSEGVWRLQAPVAGMGQLAWRAEQELGGFGRGIGSEVTTMLSDAGGSLWIGTRHSGLWRKSWAGLEHWGTSEGLAENAIRTLFLDDERNLWIGTLAGGLSRWRKAALAPSADLAGLSAGYAATPFADTRGDLWLGTWGAGLFRMHGDQVEAMAMPGMPESGAIRALAEDRTHQVWVGTWYHGVYRWDGRRFTHYQLETESPGNAVSALLADGAGVLWVGTYDGVLRYDAGVPEAGRGRAILPGRLVTAMLESGNGAVLVGTSTGLFRIHGETIETVSGLPDPYVVSLGRDSMGTLWAGTRAGGLARVLGTVAHQLPTDSGVPTLPVHTMVEDQGGRLWLGTSRGIVRVAVADLGRVADGLQSVAPAVLLDRRDGMRSSACSGSSRPLATRMPDGTLWFATTKGFVHTTDEAMQTEVAQPLAEVRGWALSNDAEVATVKTGARAVLQAGEPDILVFFWAKLLANPSQIEFRYRLAGYDRDWTPTRARVARYRRLPPGRYRFEVQARNSGGAWTTSVASLDVVQRPHFYQSWYFFALLLLLLGLATWYYLRHRIRREKGSLGIVLEERNRIAQECHDTLMAGFAAVSWQLEATAKLFREGGNTSEEAAESFELARSMVSLCQAEARRIIWDLRDTNEVTSSLPRALGRMLDVNHLSERAKMQLEVSGDEVALPPACVHHLTCIGQEAVANALRHGQANHVEVTVRFESEALLLQVADDGCGFSGNEGMISRRGHFGIAVMEERARKVGGTFRLQSHIGIGTEVTVSVPFDALALPLQQQEENVLRWIGI